MDLPPYWAPDQVQIDGIDEPTTWQTEPRVGGGTRVLIYPPPSVELMGDVRVRLSATIAGAGRSDTLALPKVQPVGARIADERWVARTDPGLRIWPTEARGLAWIEPSNVTFEPTGPSEVEALAWRWIDPDGQAQVEISRTPAPPSARVLETVTVGDGRMLLEARVTVDPAEGAVRRIPIHLSETIEPSPEWRLVEDEAGPPIAARPISPEDRPSHGFPGDGSAWELELPHPTRSRTTLLARIETDWKGQGSIPLLTLADPFRSEGTVLVVVERTLRSSVATRGLRRLDPGLTLRRSCRPHKPEPPPRPSPVPLMRGTAWRTPWASPASRRGWSSGPRRSTRFMRAG